jgi:hypothetical protein
VYEPYLGDGRRVEVMTVANSQDNHPSGVTNRRRYQKKGQRGKALNRRKPDQ